MTASLLTLVGVVITVTGTILIALFKHVNDMVAQLSAGNVIFGDQINDLTERVTTLEATVDHERTARREAEEALHDEEHYTEILVCHINQRLPPPPPERPKK